MSTCTESHHRHLEMSLLPTRHLSDVLPSLCRDDESPSTHQSLIVTRPPLLRQRCCCYRCCCLIGAFTVFQVAHHALRRFIVLSVEPAIVLMCVPEFHVSGRPYPTLGCHLCTAFPIHTRPGQALLDKTASLECSAIPKIILSPNALWL
jgi:hypothetical protein